MKEELPKQVPPPRVAESLDLEDEPVTNNLSTLLEQVAKNYPNNVAVVSLHQDDAPSQHSTSKDDISAKPSVLTFDHLRSRSLRLAHYLVSQGVRPGDRIVTLLYNQAEWAICFWAAAYAGCVFVPLDPRSMARREEASHLLRTANASTFVVATPQIATSVADILDGEVKVGVVVDSSTGTTPTGWSTLGAEMTRTVDERAQSTSTVAASDPAIMFFTSGTSALPKACPQSSINIATPALALAKRTDVDRTSSVCQHLPSFHVFSVVLSLSLWFNGGRVVFPSATFDPAASIKAIELSPRVSVPCVPLMLQAIANLPSRPQTFPSLHCIIMGGAPLSSQAMELAKGLKPTWLAMGYGLSEGVVTLVDVQKGDIARTRSNGDVSSGHAVSGSKIRICSPGSRTPLLRGELGELHQGGPAVFDGYLGIESSSCYKDEGISWLATGDQAYMDDDGYIYFLGRYKDLIIRGGENISPEKIEEYLFKQQSIVVSIQRNHLSRWWSAHR
jgi:acyl-CoA synthetase (AMP-forming)/AMP-acid ligase II